MDWSATIGGALVATVVSLILISFGSAIGLSFSATDTGSELSLKWVAIAVGLWLLWTAVVSAAAGGYFAGRMRKPAGDTTPEEVDTRDGAHGIAVWALAALLSAALAAAGVGGAFSAVASSAAAASDNITAALSDSADYVAGVALRTPNGMVAEDARSGIAAILVRSLDEGEVSEQDRQYLAQVVANRTGIPVEEARARIDAAVTEAGRVRTKAVEAARTARTFAIIAAFMLAASLLVSGVAAYLAAVAGGNHRDRHLPFSSTAARRVSP